MYRREHADMPCTCRLIPPDVALRLGSYPGEATFDLSALAALRERLVEVTDVRLELPGAIGPAVTMLGNQVARFLLEQGHDFVFTAVPVDASDGGHAASFLHATAAARSAAPEDLRVTPRRALPFDRISASVRLRPSPLLHGWMRLGAWVCGDVGAGREPGSAEIPLLLPLARLRSRRARRFVAQAA